MLTQATLLSGGTADLSLDATGVTNLLQIPNDRAWQVEIDYIATVYGTSGSTGAVTYGSTKTQNINIGFKRITGSSFLVGSGLFSTAQEDANMATGSLSLSVGATGDLKMTWTNPTFVGGGSLSIRVVAHTKLTEVATTA
jgi:hypothetical protein